MVDILIERLTVYFLHTVTEIICVVLEIQREIIYYMLPTPLI